MTSNKLRAMMKTLYARKRVLRCAVCGVMVRFAAQGRTVRCYYHRNP